MSPQTQILKKLIKSALTTNIRRTFKKLHKNLKNSTTIERTFTLMQFQKSSRENV